MGWDSVPWFVGGGAQHSPEVARLMAYVAFRGNEGILGTGDLKVSALTVPGASVNVAPGACSVLTRSPGESYQAYAGRLPTQDTVGIAATGSSSGRSDLIVVRVEDPNNAGETWPAPAAPTVGPYIFTRVISGVPAGTTDVASLGLGFSAIALARIDIPASTATVTDAMIVDLRKVANPRRERGVDAAFPASTQSANSSSYSTLSTSRQFAVPSWATHAVVKATVSGARLATASAAGGLRAAFCGQNSQDTVWDENWTGTAARTTYEVAAELTVGASQRGTNQTVTLQGRRSSGTGALTVDTGSTVTYDVEFLEKST